MAMILFRLFDRNIVKTSYQLLALMRVGAEASAESKGNFHGVFFV